MRRYFNKEDFVVFINLLEENKITKVYTEDLANNNIAAYKFMKISFSGNIITLYEHPSGVIGILQDTPAAPWEKYAKMAYKDFTIDDEFKMFIISD